MHPLLLRQLRKVALATESADPRLAALLRAVDDAYTAADEERRQLERSLFLASDELFERNRRLERELLERKRLEVELQHGEKLRAVGQLAAGVAHEINTPIQYIGDSVAFLADAFSDIEAALAASDKPHEHARARREIPLALGRCRDGADRVTTIVRALRMLAHPDGREQELADLGHAIENTLIVVASQLRYVAITEVELESSRKIRCHIGEIQQVLLNLLVNAGHAVGERVAGTEERGTIRIATRDDGDDVVVTVSDDGPGIPSAIRARVFEPFFTTKPVGTGTGQGLSIVHALVVERHAGHISFESAVGVGTTFTVRLPVAGRPLPAREVHA